MRTVLVTGGTGFIGSHLTSSLLAQDYRVVVLDDMSRGDWNNIRSFYNFQTKFHVVSGSVTDFDLLDRPVTEADFVLKLAAQVHWDESINYPRRSFEINALGTLSSSQYLLTARTSPSVGWTSSGDSGACSARRASRCRFPTRSGITSSFALWPVLPGSKVPTSESQDHRRGGGTC